MGTKELKIVKDNESRQDRISALPDSLIHHILSFLPSTKHAIRTSVLSKRWHKQWTHVPVLVFDFPKSNRIMSRVSTFIDNTLILYNSSKIKKFHLRLPFWYDTNACPIPDLDHDHDDDADDFMPDSICDEKLRFAITKEILSAMEIAGASACQSLNKKCLTFDCGTNFVEYLPGIAYALRTSPELEKLVILLRLPEYPTSQDRQDLYRIPNGAVFDCLVSHLKIIKVIGVSEKDEKLSFVLNFVEFLLMNGKVLEKMVVVLQNCSTDFVFEVSQKLLAFPRYSQHVMIEII